MKEYDVWIEGHQATGDSSTASKLGTFEASSFRVACIAWASTLDPDGQELFDQEALTYWGCRLFDNEQDARKAFG